MTDEQNEEIDLDKPLAAEGPDTFDDAPFDDFESGGEGTLGNVLRNNPMAKVGLVVGVFVVLVGGILLFGGKKDEQALSSVGGGSDLSEAPGDEVSESYRRAVEEKNVQNVEEAIRTGSSALPVPVSSPQGRVDAGTVAGPGEDPLERWRRIQEERQRRETQQLPSNESTGDPNAAAIDALAEAMADQMSSILENTQPQKMQSVDVAQLSFLEEQREKAATKAAASAAAGTADGDEVVLDIIIPAGTVEYAQLLTEANSDAPGPILAEIASGPLKGSRVLGAFEVMDQDYLVLTFEQVVIDGISYDIDAVALDPKTTNPGMVTDVDHRYLKRVVLPAASAFIEGVAETVAETGSSGAVTDGGTVTTSQEEPSTEDAISAGIEKASSKVTDLLDQEAAKTKVMVKVASGTPMGILFVEPVTKGEMRQ